MPRSRWVTISLTSLTSLLVILPYVLEYLIGQIPDYRKFPNQIKNEEWLIIGATVLGILLTVAIRRWLKYREGSEAAESANTRSHFSPKKLLDTRKKLLRRLEGDVKSRLKSSLLTKLDFQMEDQRQQIGKPQAQLVAEDPLRQMIRNIRNRLFQPFQRDASAAPLQPTQKIIEVFKRSDVQGKLLILGEPGAGKTTELLTLSEDLLQQAVDEASHPIPVIFELSGWKEDKPIAQWLVEKLEEIYKIPNVIGQQWLDEHQLLPLLDGLDELGLVRQQKCIEAINQFLTEQGQPQCVVCCRREEYEQGQVKLEQMNGAVYLQPLTDKQIEEYFQKLNRSKVWNNIQKNPELLELAHIPLFLHMLVYAYQGNQGRVIQNSQELFETYIEQRLNDPRSQGVYPPSKAPSSVQTRHYLVWLARQLEERHQTEFLIEGMQADWLGSVKQKRLYRVLSRLIFWLIFGLIGGLIFGLSFGLSFGLIGGLIFGLIFWLSFGTAYITPTEQLSWSWQGVKKQQTIILIFGLVSGLIFGLGSGLFNSLARPVDQLILGLVNGLVIGLVSGLIFGLIFGVSSFEVENKTIPNQGILRSAVNAGVVGLISGLFFGLFFGLFLELNKGLSGMQIGVPSDLLSDLLIVGLVSGLIVGLLNGGMAVIQHLILRLILHYNGYIPWDYKLFLDHVVQHRFIQRVGGRYRFMHDLLRKHFAEMAE